MPRPLFSGAALSSGGVASTVGYKLDLSGEPSEGVRAFLGIPIDSVGDGKSVSLRYRLGGLGEEVAAQVRVRQYEKADAEAYYPLLDWQEVEGAGQQTLEIPIDSERIAAGGRTYVEWRFQRRGGGSFEKGAVELQDIAYERKHWDWYTQVVMSCEQEDNYRFGYNGQEKVNEISGVGNHNTALFWEYDTRLGRRWNLDPKPIVGISDYSAFTNNPILYNDPNGDIIVFDKSTTTQFRQDFMKAATHLIKHGQVKELMQVYTSPKVYVIKEAISDKSEFVYDMKSGGGTIKWNPLIGIRTNNDKKLSPTSILNHEVDHAAKWDKVGAKSYFKDLVPNSSKQYDTKEEERVITGSEQRTAKALGEIKEGEVTRKDHGVKKVIDTNSPTSTEGTERQPSEGLEEVIVKPKK